MGDSPTLPEWGMIFLMALMIAIGHKVQLRSLKLNGKMQSKGKGH